MGAVIITTFDIKWNFSIPFATEVKYIYFALKYIAINTAINIYVLNSGLMLPQKYHRTIPETVTTKNTEIFSILVRYLNVLFV